jgi:5-methylthioadenosine/S-adenosylhomocysteine deaminase
MPIKSASLAICAKWIIPVFPKKTCLQDYAIVINQDKIIDLLPQKKLKKIYAPKETNHLSDHLLMPGLINMHTHSPMVLIRGLGQDQNIKNWLTKYIWPAEQALMSQSFIKDGTQLAMTEMLKNGITTFNEHYFSSEIIYDVIDQYKMRAAVGKAILNMSNESFDKLNTNLEDISHWLSRKHPLISTSLAAHSEYMLTDQQLKDIAMQAQKFGSFVHIHCMEGIEERNNCLAKHQKTPINRLLDANLITPRTQLVHMVDVNDHEWDQLAKIKPQIITCPLSNHILGSGQANIMRPINRGLNVCIGTDGAASNNCLDILQETRFSLLCAKGLNQDPTCLSCWDGLDMMTINAAKALGLDEEVGSLEIGKQADLIAVNLNQLNTHPRHEPLAQWMFAGSSEQVTHAWVAGKCLLNQRKIMLWSEEDLQEKAKQWEEKTKPFYTS